MKKIISTLMVFVAGAAMSNAADYYFTQGVQNESTYTRDWSDLRNWSTVEVSSSTSDIGNKWNVNQATSDVTGMGTRIFIGYFSAKSGNTLGEAGNRFVNVDTKDVVISYLEFQERSNLADHVKGEDLTFETSNGGGTIITKNRTYGNSIIDNNLILKTTAAGGINYKITNYTNAHLYINGDISVSGTMNSATYEPLTVYSQMSSTTSPKGNVYLNGAILFDRCLIVEKSGSGSYIASKVYLQGASDNKNTLKIRNGGVAVLNKDAGFLAANSYEIYTGGIAEVMSSTQISAKNNIKSMGVGTTGDNVSGSILMHGNSVTVGTITISPASAVLENEGITQLFKFDFGDELYGQGRELSFAKLSIDKSGNKINFETSGLLIVNFDAQNDKIYSTTASENYADNIFFSDYGVKGVDYDVEATKGADNYWYYTVVAIPEPSTIAAILGLSALGLAIVRRRK